jgi:hypothetical protein
MVQVWLFRWLVRLVGGGRPGLVVGAGGGPERGGLVGASEVGQPGSDQPVMDPGEEEGLFVAGRGALTLISEDRQLLPKLLIKRCYFT